MSDREAYFRQLDIQRNKVIVMMSHPRGRPTGTLTTCAIPGAPLFETPGYYSSENRLMGEISHRPLDQHFVQRSGASEQHLIGPEVVAGGRGGPQLYYRGGIVPHDGLIEEYYADYYGNVHADNFFPPFGGYPNDSEEYFVVDGHIMKRRRGEAAAVVPVGYYPHADMLNSIAFASVMHKGNKSHSEVYRVRCERKKKFYDKKLSQLVQLMTELSARTGGNHADFIGPGAKFNQAALKKRVRSVAKKQLTLVAAEETTVTVSHAGEGDEAEVEVEAEVRVEEKSKLLLHPPHHPSPSSPPLHPPPSPLYRPVSQEVISTATVVLETILCGGDFSIVPVSKVFPVTVAFRCPDLDTFDVAAMLSSPGTGTPPSSEPLAIAIATSDSDSTVVAVKRSIKAALQRHRNKDRSSEPLNYADCKFALAVVPNTVMSSPFSGRFVVPFAWSSTGLVELGFDRELRIKGTFLCSVSDHRPCGLPDAPSEAISTRSCTVVSTTTAPTPPLSDTAARGRAAAIKEGTVAKEVEKEVVVTEATISFDVVDFVRKFLSSSPNSADEGAVSSHDHHLSFNGLSARTAAAAAGHEDFSSLRPI